MGKCYATFPCSGLKPTAIKQLPSFVHILQPWALAHGNKKAPHLLKEGTKGVVSRVSKAVFYETVKEEFVGGWNFHETNLWLDQNTKLSKKQKGEIRKMIELVENK